MGALIIVAVMISAVLSDAGRPLRPFDLDRVPPPLPEHVAVFAGSNIA